MQFNVIYTNDAPRTPTGGTSNQTVAGLSSASVYFQSVALPARSAPSGNQQAAAVIQSNGEDIGNAKATGNPLPPGVTS
jgi:hypothetical protein